MLRPAIGAVRVCCVQALEALGLLGERESPTSPREDAHQLTCDLDASLGDMGLMTRPNAGPGVLLPERLRRHGVDIARLETGERELLRELLAVCTRCQHWRRCARDIAARDAATGFGAPPADGYCVNAGRIARLLAATNQDLT